MYSFNLLKTVDFAITCISHRPKPEYTQASLQRANMDLSWYLNLLFVQNKEWVWFGNADNMSRSLYVLQVEVCGFVGITVFPRKEQNDLIMTKVPSLYELIIVLHDTYWLKTTPYYGFWLFYALYLLIA